MAASAIDIPGTHKAITAGWGIAIGCIGAVLLSGLPVIGVIAFGVMAIAFIYQLTQLLRGK